MASYQGVVIYRSGANMESLKLIHGMINGAEHERISALTGEPREVIRDDDHVICLMPNDRKMDFNRPPLKGLLASLTPQALQKVAAWYSVNELGAARVAGRICRGVEMAPRDDYRYRFEIWSDEVTGVPLRVALTTANHQVLEEVMFTEVSFPASLPLQAFESELDPKRFRITSHAAVAPANSGPVDWSGFPVRLEVLPPGYEVKARDRRSGTGGRGNVDHLLLSDGLSAISIFAAQGVPNERAFSGLTQMGGVYAFGRVVGEYHVTVVGETPAAAVRMVAEKLLPADNDAKP